MDFLQSGNGNGYVSISFRILSNGSPHTTDQSSSSWKPIRYFWVRIQEIINVRLNVPIWIQRPVYNFTFVQICSDISGKFQIFSDLFRYFAIFPDLFRFIEIFLDLSEYIYMCWHKTKAKWDFVQWITSYRAVSQNYQSLLRELLYKQQLVYAIVSAHTV